MKAVTVILMVLFGEMINVDAYYKRGSAAMGGFSKLFFTPDLTIFSNYNDLLHDLLMSDSTGVDTS